MSDDTFAECLVAVEVALARAWAAVGIAPAPAVDEISRVFDENHTVVNVAELARAAVAGGNPVIPLVPLMRSHLSEEAAAWLHRGPTSQDIVDSALMLMMQRAASAVLDTTRDARETLAAFALAEAETVAAGRTLTQHAVPTTVGLRATQWLSGIDRAAAKLGNIVSALPVSLAGAGGTLASFTEIAGADVAGRLPEAFARELGLQPPAFPWHVTRWPVTELGDALVALTGAFGVLAADVATLSRTEIGELTEGIGGGSSAMPQKSNPTASVLIRSAAIRAPHLAATLHTASALAVDERPDGAWHAEWQTLRELMRLALGVAHTGRALISGLTVNHDRVAANLGATGGAIVAERLAIALTPIIGSARVHELVREAGDDLGALLKAEPKIREAGINVDALLDPAEYTGLAAALTHRYPKE